ncbi:unnamed protein product [Orchesella dallaii]|uniref:Uncharacterized protein n=1 Tax=Orchesella dallaii TaxID=48710 RepID=A0ABP1RA34_9HEXA
MKAKNVQISIAFLLCVGAISCLKNKGGSSHHDLEKSNSTEFDFDFQHEENPINHFEKLKNLTEQEKDKLKRLKVCGSLLGQEDLREQLFATCLAEIKSKKDSKSEDQDKSFRKRRNALINDMDYGFNNDYYNLGNSAVEDNNIDDHKQMDIKLKRRPRRQAGISVSGRPKNGHWSMFAAHIRRNPCILSCIWGKQGLINSTGGLDMDAVLDRVENLLILANTTEPKMMASKVVNICITHQQHLMESRPQLFSGI